MNRTRSTSLMCKVVQSGIAGICGFFLAMLTANTAQAEPVRDLQKVVDSSDLVAVVKVLSVVQTSSGTVSVGTQTYLAHFRVATLQPVCILKGQPPSGDVSVPYTILYSPGGWGGGVPRGYTVGDTLKPNAFRMVFLRRVGDQFQLTNGSYLSIVAPSTPSTCRADDDPLTGIVTQLADVLFSAGSMEDKKYALYHKYEALGQLTFIDHPQAVPILKRFLLGDTARTVPWLGDQAILAILAHKDLSVVSLVEPALLRSENISVVSQPNLMFALIGAVPASRSVPILAKAIGVSNPILRTKAAEALYNTGSPLAIPALLSALEDTNSDVAFAVMQGLGNLTKEYAWRPRSTEHNDSWHSCLNHWREYRTRWKNLHKIE